MNARSIMDGRKARASAYIRDVVHGATHLPVDDLLLALDLLTTAYRAERTIFVCGNGGSAAAASHLALDLAKNTRAPGRPSLRAVSLVDHGPALTAWANDVDYDAVFSQQLEGLARPGDVLVVISTSGESRNVLSALEWARPRGITSIGLLGAAGGRALSLCSVAVRVPVEGVEQQEDVQVMITHLLTRGMRDVVGQVPT